MFLRPILLSGLAVFALSMTPALAQESGGVRLSAEALNTENAQGRVLEHVVGQIQRIQLLRAAGTTGAAAAPGAAGANAADPAADRQSVNQQAVARFRGDAGFLAGFSRGQPLAASRVPPPPPIELPPPLIVNAFESPVTIGSNNVVHQQVSNSIAIGTNASASTVAQDGPHSRGKKSASSAPSDGAATVQSAVSQALAVNGGAARSTAINSSVAGRDDR
jgi:hypothetical protein